MTTPFQIPRFLRQYTGGRAELQLAGATVGDLLAELSREYPALYGCICQETGAVRPHVNLFVNNDRFQDRQGMETTLGNGDVVSVFTAVSGG